MINLLSQRLINAKRELTALKTAHARGIGNLMVYRRNEQLTSPGATTEDYEITINITFSQEFSAYPFVNIVEGVEPATVSLFTFNQFEYTNSGMSATVLATGRFEAGASMPYQILSLAPIVSITTNWSII